LSFSASEISYFFRILPLIIGDLIPEDDVHFPILIKLKQILDIIFVKKHHKDAYKSLEVHIENYLKILAFLNFPIKPKHHFLVHYSRIMKEMAPLGKISSMRFESKHQIGKVISNVSRSRVNICHQIATKYQQIFCKNSKEIWKCNLYDIGPTNFHLHSYEISGYHQFAHLLPFEKNVHDKHINTVKYCFYLGREIRPEECILMIPKENGLSFLKIKHIITSDLHPDPFIIGTKIRTMYIEHLDAYEILSTTKYNWLIVSVNDLHNCFITYTVAL